MCESCVSFFFFLGCFAQVLVRLFKFFMFNLCKVCCVCTFTKRTELNVECVERRSKGSIDFHFLKRDEDHNMWLHGKKGWK
jgi:hypothetical protein